MIPNLLYMSPSDSLDHPGSILYNLESSEVPYSTNRIGQEFLLLFLTATGYFYVLGTFISLLVGLWQESSVLHQGMR